MQPAPTPGGEAPQFHQLAPEGQAQAPRPEREGEEQRRGRRNRGGRDRHRGERGDRPREERPSGGTPSIIEEQRRIHELESRREKEQRHGDAHTEEPRAHAEIPAYLAKEATQAPAPVESAPPVPVAREPKVDPKELLESAGLVMIETDRSKAPPAPQVEEPVHLGRPRRERPKDAAQDDTLVQIETTRK